MQYVAPYPPASGHHPVNYNYSHEPPRDPQLPHSYQQVAGYHQNQVPSQNIPCKPDPAAFEQQQNYEQAANYSSPPPPTNFENHQRNNFVQPSTPNSQVSEPVPMVYGEPPTYAPRSQEPVQSPAPSMEPPTPQIPPPVETQYSDSDSGSDYDPKQDGVSKVKVEPKKEKIEEEEEDDDEVIQEPSDDDSDSDYGAKKVKPRKRKRAPPKPRQTRQSSNTPRATRSSKSKKIPTKKEKEEVEIEVEENDIKESPPPSVKKESVNELSNQVQVLFLPSENDPPNVAMLKKRLLELSEADIEKTKKLKLLQNLTWRQKKEIQKLKEEIKKVKGRSTQNSNNVAL